MNEIYLIAAVDEKFGIGKEGGLPWDLKKEMKYFQKTTLNTVDCDECKNTVIMGRSTWESIPEKHRPLKGRHNIVLTRNSEYIADGAEIAQSIDDAVILARKQLGTIFIIGGGRVYEESIKRDDVDGVYLTEIHSDFNCDTFFPEIQEEFKNKKIIKSVSENEIDFDFCLYTK